MVVFRGKLSWSIRFVGVRYAEIKGLYGLCLFIVYASRIQLKPFAGQRLEVARHMLEAWEAPLESSWWRLGASETSSGSWRLPELSWRLLGRLGAVLGAVEAMAEPSAELPRPFYMYPEGSWQCLHCFFTCV